MSKIPYKNWSELKFIKYPFITSDILFDVSNSWLLYTDSSTGKKRILDMNDLPQVKITGTHNIYGTGDKFYEFGFQGQVTQHKYCFFDRETGNFITCNKNPFTYADDIDETDFVIYRNRVPYWYDVKTDTYLPYVDDFSKEKYGTDYSFKLKFYPVLTGYEETDVDSGIFKLLDGSSDNYFYEEIYFNKEHSPTYTKVERFLTWKGLVVGLHTGREL